MQIQKLLLDGFAEVASASDAQVAGPRFQPVSRLLLLSSVFLFPFFPGFLLFFLTSFLSLSLFAFFPSFLFS